MNGKITQNYQNLNIFAINVCGMLAIQLEKQFNDFNLTKVFISNSLFFTTVEI